MDFEEHHLNLNHLFLCPYDNVVSLITLVLLT
jgi:hypothetical protein